MPTFDTPEPVAAVVELVVGDVRITASDRDDTAVEVRPSDESHEPDVRAAEQTRSRRAKRARPSHATQKGRHDTSSSRPCSGNVTPMRREPQDG